MIMSQPAPKLDDLLRTDSELASLPEIYIRVSDLLDNDNSTATQIGHVVETDPALTSRILKMVNSAFYGYSNRIASISQSITILGRDRLRQILIGSVLGGIFGKMSSPVLPMKDYWYHSVKSALLSRELGKASSLSEISDVLFTAGLLHELGRLILSHKLPDHYQQVLDAMQTGSAEICATEQQVFGYDHCAVGEAFIRKWGLPEVLAVTTRFHHQPDEANSEHDEEVLLVYLANLLSNLEPATDPVKIEEVLDNVDGWQQLGLEIDDVLDACELADQQVYEVMDSLGMGQMVIEATD